MGRGREDWKPGKGKNSLSGNPIRSQTCRKKTKHFGKRNVRDLFNLLSGILAHTRSPGHPVLFGGFNALKSSFSELCTLIWRKFNCFITQCNVISRNTSMPPFPRKFTYHSVNRDGSCCFSCICSLRSVSIIPWLFHVYYCLQVILK